MEIIHQSDAIHREKPDGTRVDYYLQPEYEIHYNEIPAGIVQEWHSHEQIEDVVLIIEGQLEVKWINDKEERKASLKSGDLVRVENTIHTFANTGDREAKFLVFKMVLEGKNNSKILKEDKIPVSKVG